MSNISSFGRAVKIRLIEIEKTQRWLVGEVKTATGLYFDDGYLYKVLSGRCNNPKIIEAIKDILSI